MFNSSVLSRIEEKLWLFQLKYLPFYIYNGWIVLLLAIVWFITLPLWLPKMIKELLEDKNILLQGAIFSAIVTLLGLSFYLYAILGEPNQEKWEQKIFPKHIAQIATKVYDSTDKMIGGVVNTKLQNSNKHTFYVENVPKLYWNILKFREEIYLDFNNDKTGIMGIIKNHRSFNGIDPIGIPSAILKGRGGSSLSQQLVKNFYGQDFFNSKTSFRVLNTILRKSQELIEAKTFYHNLRKNNGEEFKRWIAMYPPSLVSNGSVYGIESVSAVVFGKKPKNLTEVEQIILSEMYKYTYYFRGKVNKIKCQRIKKGAKIDIRKYFQGNDKKIAQLNRDIDRWSCPNEPRVPFAFYDDMKQQDSKGKAIIGNPNNRIWEWASTSASTLKDELDNYRKHYQNRLITEAKMSIDVPKNIEFKDNINRTLKIVENSLGSRLKVNLDGNQDDNRTQANIWVSVVNKIGEIVYLYKRGNIKYRRRIGSISKIFESIALGNRGDKWNYYYCNEPFRGLHNSNGSQGGECKDNSDENIYSARRVFGASKNLPMKSALEKYVIKNKQGVKIINDRVSDKTLQDIYRGFNLGRDNNTSMRYELSFGLVNSTPFNLQKAIHKLANILYYRGNYREAHLIKSLKYKTIVDSYIEKGGVESDNIYLKSINIQNLFSSNTKEYMRTVLKSALNRDYGTLRSFNSISNFQQLFMKSGTTDKIVGTKRLTQSKWVAGAIKVQGEPYSFVIMVESENGIGKNIRHNEISKVIFKEIVHSLNSYKRASNF